MTTEKKLLGVNPVAVGGAEAVSFDGTNDYLSRSSDLQEEYIYPQQMDTW